MENSINNTPTYYSNTGEIGKPVDLGFCTQDLSAISIIFQTVNDTSFNNELARVYVSHHNHSYTFLGVLDLGAKNVMSYSITTENQGQFGNILFFNWIKIKVESIENTKLKIVVSGR